MATLHLRRGKKTGVQLFLGPVGGVFSFSQKKKSSTYFFHPLEYFKGGGRRRVTVWKPGCKKKGTRKKRSARFSPFAPRGHWARPFLCTLGFLQFSPPGYRRELGSAACGALCVCFSLFSFFTPLPPKGCGGPGEAHALPFRVRGALPFYLVC